MPFDGLLSFDNAGLATLIVLLVMLQQDVSTLLHATVDSCGNSAGILCSLRVGCAYKRLILSRLKSQNGHILR